MQHVQKPELAPPLDKSAPDSAAKAGHGTMEFRLGYYNNDDSPSDGNPFLDEDYRAPDYLAALITGGVFVAAGFEPGADRRDDSTGQQGGDIVNAFGDVRISTSDLSLIDGVTAATRNHGVHVIEWLPLDRDLQRIQQGEYLVNVVINLDRDPVWPQTNDLETCWGDPADVSRGAHRIVRRVGLGATPFELTMGQSSELAGSDQEAGADQLRYVKPQGVTIRWVQAN